MSARTIWTVLNVTLKRMERFWIDQVRFRL